MPGQMLAVNGGLVFDIVVTASHLLLPTWWSLRKLAMRRMLHKLCVHQPSYIPIPRHTCTPLGHFLHLPMYTACGCERPLRHK